MKAIHVSHYNVRPVGHGGYHRTYQIQHDLELAVGKDNVVTIDNPRLQESRSPLVRVARKIRRALILSTVYAENPHKLLAKTYFTKKLFSFPDLLAHYERVVKDIAKPAVCVIQHPGFADLVQINLRHGIPTISCTQNLEAFDTSVLYRRKWGMYAKVIDFANEFGVFAQCAERLFISKVEAGLISGLGLPSYYYPYLPVRVIRKRLEWIRQERSKGHIAPGLFLMLGTAGHDTTKESFAWFVQNAQVYGLPSGVKVVVGGLQTDELLPPGSSVSGLELKGWLEQEDLDQLLVRAKAVLAPQRFGFGALTRLPELSCAGIPVVVSRHATYAIDPTPGLEIVNDDWDAWYAKMEQLAKNNVYLSEDDYYAWEQGQPRTLEAVVKKLLEEFC
jgi:hypothetical protein